MYMHAIESYLRNVNIGANSRPPQPDSEVTRRVVAVLDVRGGGVVLGELGRVIELLLLFTVVLRLRCFLRRKSV